ncbi:MAG TPA: rod shape-determining protein MreC [Crocinitomix sp.]|nr:rod shape-determining protein MreC [Crocinitomix sp.]
MKNLINFLKRFRDLLIFFLLQVIILSFLFKTKNYHNAIFFNTSNTISGWLTEKRNNVVKHFSLEGENEMLKQKNAELLATQYFSFYKLQNKVFTINDSIYEQQYSYIPASVIKTSTTRRDNYITIDKGTLQNIHEGMGVITNEGIVGFVIKSSSHYSLILTVLSEKINIPVKFKHQNKVRGHIKWDGSDYTKVQLHGITNDINVLKGDTIVTKGSSGIFPEGIPVGIVKKASNQNGEITLDIEVELTTNFKTINTVYVVKNMFKSEQEKLENGFFDE